MPIFCHKYARLLKAPCRRFAASRLTSNPIGWSLWLVPPPRWPLSPSLSTLITDKLPPLISGTTHAFAPHITLTSNIPASTAADATPQALLDALDLGSLPTVRVRFAGVQARAAFFKKLYLQCERDAGLVALATRCREVGVCGGDAREAGRWAEREYDPHCSLV